MKIWGLKHKFNSIIEYKISIQILIVFLYTNNEISEKEIKKAIAFAIISKRTKYFGIN